MQNGEDYSAISHCLVWGDAEEPIAQPAEGVKGRLSQFPTPSPDGELFATPQPKGGVVISERVSGKALHTLKTPWEVMCLAFSADGRSLVCWERKQVSVAASVWDVRTGQKRGGWAVEDSRLGNAPPLAISVDGLRVAIGTDSRGMKGKLQVWDVATESLQWEFTATVNPATAVAFSPDGRMLATGGEDGVVRLWETFTGQERLLLTGHRARIWSLAFAPDGQRLASASADSTALIWETRPTRRSETKVDSLWTALSGSDAAAAYQAILALAETPKTSLPLLRQWLKPPTPEPGQVEKWVTELGADRASVRDAATFALTAQGDRVEAVLRKALKDNPTPEARKRLTKLIDSFGPASPWKLGVKRGVEALERMSADPEARKLLAELAKEPVDDFQKKEVEAARERLPGSE